MQKDFLLPADSRPAVASGLVMGRGFGNAPGGPAHRPPMKTLFPPHEPAAPRGSRLQFIDMARSLAILLMLEGHFVGLTLSQEARDSTTALFHIWNYLRGLAAPLFFTVTGLVFTYLLLGSGEGPFFRLPRVRKGLRRAAELLGWGYLLQLDLAKWGHYLRGDFGSWPQAFHVLQCIGCGLLLLIGLYALQRRLPGLSLVAVYAVGGGILFGISVGLARLPADPFAAAGLPEILRNPLRGPYSVFPLSPWLAFTCFGAALGALVRLRGEQVRETRFALGLLAAGVFLRLTGWLVDAAAVRLADELLGPAATAPPEWFHSRLGDVIILLGMLLWIENRFHPKDSWFQEIGRNTFLIYVFHVIVLYGGLFGIGLNDLLDERLNLWQSALGALLFMASFAALAQLPRPLRRRWQARRNRATPHSPSRPGPA